MNSKISVLPLIGCFSVILPFFGPVQAGIKTDSESKELVVCSWNVENLFDTEDDPANEGDDPYTPRGWRRWSDNRYRMKLNHLAEVIAAMKPDILCMQEVENRRVLQDLTDVLKKNHRIDYPGIVHRDSMDFRGIDVAIIATRPAKKAEWIAPSTNVRDTVVATFSYHGGDITVLANHWKSKLGNSEESQAKRRSQAICVRQKLNELLAADTNSAIIVTGDFNDAPDSKPMVADALLLTNRIEVLSRPGGLALFNLAASLPASVKGSYYYGPANKWEMLDSMSVTAGMLAERATAPWLADERSYRVFKYPKHVDRYGNPAPFRRIRNRKVGDIYATGFSDHFPVMLKLKRRP